MELYKKLTKRYHPDTKNGDAEIMVKINSAYTNYKKTGDTKYLDILKSYDVKKADTLNNDNQLRTKSNGIILDLKKLIRYLDLIIDLTKEPISYDFKLKVLSVVSDTLSGDDVMIILGVP